MKRIDHYVLKEDEGLLLAPDQLYGYVFGANGIFVAGSNEYFSALVPVREIKDRALFIRGLQAVKPYVKMYRRVPAEVLRRALNYARLVQREGGHELYLSMDPVGNWVLSTFEDEAGNDVVLLRLHYSDCGFSRNPVEDRARGDMRIIVDVWNLSAAAPSVRLRIGIMAHEAEFAYRLLFEEGVEVVNV